MNKIIHHSIRKKFTAIFFTSAFLFMQIFISTSQASPVVNNKVVKVNNVIDFYKAIGSNTTIMLAPGDYHLNQIDSTIKNSNCNWSWVLFDEIYPNEKNDEDMTLLISGLNNFTIKTDCKKGDSVRILTNRRAASVMAFKNCTSINIDGVIFGHDIIKYTDPGEPWVSFCSGEVLKFYDCTDINITNCDLFGCGTRGFLAHRCTNFTFEKSVIRECSYGAFGTFSSKNVIIKNSVFKNNTYRIFIEIEKADGVKMINTKLQNNTQAGYMETPYKVTDSKNIESSNLIFKDNDFNTDFLFYDKGKQ
jgi:hypothetical protein